MMEIVKIVRIITRLNVGGPAIHSVLLTAGLDKNRFRTLLVAGSIGPDEGDMRYYAQEKGVSVEYIPELRRELSLKNDLRAFLKIYRLLKKEKPRILHTHTSKAGTLGRCAGILYNLLSFRDAKKITLVHTFHGHVLSGYFTRAQNFFFTLIERWLGMFTDRIIIVSDSVRKELLSLKIASPGKMEVIPLGFELDKFFSIPCPPDPREQLHIGIVGRLVPIKNHRLFLRTAARFAKEYADIKARFTIIGDGELRNSLEDLTDSLGLRRIVEFSGWRKDIENVYAQLDIVMLTSDNEGTPVSLIEAMASARPVVAPDVGGVRDLLGLETAVENGKKLKFNFMERGLLVESGDESGFVAALTFLAANKETRKKLGLSGRDFVKSFYSKERLIHDIETLYQDLLK